MDRETLERLSKDELITLVRAQAAQIAALTERIAALEAKVGQPPKTPDNSSVPPSRGQKPNRAERRVAKPKGRPGSFRALSGAPDRTIAVLADACPHCDHALSAGDQPDVHPYDHIDLPPIQPVVTRVLRHRGRCPCCRRAFSAPAPAGLTPGSPFGPSIVALVIHLHVTQAIGFERLSRLMAEVFGLTISEGAISNMLARRGAPDAGRKRHRVERSGEQGHRVGRDHGARDGPDVVAMGADVVHRRLPPHRTNTRRQGRHRLSERGQTGRVGGGSICRAEQPRP